MRETSEVLRLVHKTRRAVWITATVALLTAWTQPASGQDSAITHRLDEYVQAYHELGDFSGCVSVTRDEVVLLRECYGMASYELGVPNSDDTRFRIGSLSKQFTAAAVLVLQQRGVLDVDDPLAAYLPGFPRGDEITVYHLLTHTSGLRNSFALPEYEVLKRRGAEIDELVEAIGAVPLDFEPGSQYAYSNSGYIVLAHLVERLSGYSYSGFLQSAIFEPAGMTGSGVDATAPIIPNRAEGYTPAGLTGLENAPFVDPTVEVGAGDLYSTIGDLERWHDALYSDRILDESSRARMLSRQEGFYGFGIAVYEEHGRTINAHDGRVSGFSSDMSRYPADGVSVIVLSNVESGIGDSFRRDLGAIVFGAPYELPSPREAADRPPSAEELTEYAGEYEFGPGFVVTARVERGRLYVAANAGEFSELTSLRDGRFLNRMTYSMVRFERNADGAIETMVWMQDGNEFPGNRL